MPSMPLVARRIVAAFRSNFVLIMVAAAAVLRIYRDVIYPYHIGVDARIYVEASRTWLAGGDPWQHAYEFGAPYAAFPTSLLVTAPLTMLPTGAAGALLVVASATLALAAIRSLKLPIWWILWAPVLDGVLVGSLDVAALALLVLFRGRLAGIAPLVKIYAVAPIIGERRWLALAVTTALMVATLPVLPWLTFVADIGHIASLHDRAFGSMTTVYPNRLLWVAMAAGLLTLGTRRAAWLSVPMLWPFTQPHYAAIVLPFVSRSTLLATGFAWSWVIPLAAPVSVGIYVLSVWVKAARARAS